MTKGELEKLKAFLDAAWPWGSPITIRPSQVTPLIEMGVALTVTLERSELAAARRAVDDELRRA